MQDSISQSNKRVLDATTKEYSHKIYLKMAGSDNFLRKSFQEQLDNLKGMTYANNRDVFKRFIKEYGTHYFEWGSFGGMIRKYMETSDSYSYGKTDEQLKVQADASYKSLINRVSISMKYDKSETNVDSQFTASTQERIRYYGGDANLLDSRGLVYWQKTVDNDPALLEAGISPIYELVTDHSTRDQLKIAIDQHILRNYLLELDRKITIAEIKFHDSVIGRFWKRLKEFQKADMLDMDQVSALNRDIVFQTEVPDWFTDHTKFCFKYRAATSGNKQCNDREGTDSEALCSLPGGYTRTYHDNTGGVSGDLGCYLRWGILSPIAGNWFKQTKICFKWYSTVWSPGGSENCAHIGDFTTEFHDDTWNGSGKNQFQWKITVPPYAPLWFKNTQLCMEWSAYRGQCWASNKKLCAVPGRYTSVYTDNTESDYWSGCWLKWGWFTRN